MRAKAALENNKTRVKKVFFIGSNILFDPEGVTR
jgi:hypothetical protein